MITPTHEAPRESAIATDPRARRADASREDRSDFRGELSDEIARRSEAARDRDEPGAGRTDDAVHARRDERRERADQVDRRERPERSEGARRDERAEPRRSAPADAEDAHADASAPETGSDANSAAATDSVDEARSAENAGANGKASAPDDLPGAPSTGAERAPGLARGSAAVEASASRLASALAAAGSPAEAAAAALVGAGQGLARSQASSLVADSDPEVSARSAGTPPVPRADSAAVTQPSAGLALDAGTLDLLDANVAIDADVQRAIDAFSPTPRDASDARAVAHLASGAGLLAADVPPNESARVVTPPRVPPAEFPAFLDKLAVRVDASANRALVELEPPALGRLTVEIVVEDDRIRADVRVERPEGLAALEARLPELRASFTERGFTAADVQLSLGFDQPASSQRDARENQRTTRSARELELAPELLESLVPARAGGLDLWA